MESESNISTKALLEYENLYLCPISLQLMSNPVMLPCQHTFEYQLLKQHLEINEICPLCRKTFTILDAQRNLLATQSIAVYKKQVERKMRKKEAEEIKMRIKQEKKKKKCLLRRLVSFCFHHEEYEDAKSVLGICEDKRKIETMRIEPRTPRI